ncbi:hypothetical protein DMENIID0001_122070 [Sergentomyia squamirostris]
MSDSEDSDDWFNKDLEDFKAPTSSKKVVNESEEQLPNLAAMQVGESPQSFLPNTQDYGGNYGVETVSRKPAQSSYKKIHQSGSGTSSFSQKMSTGELGNISHLNPLDIFLEVMFKAEKFKETALDDDKSQERVILLIIILGKIYTVPLEYFLDDVTKMLFSNNEKILENDILTYVQYAIELEESKKPNVLPLADEVWSSLETFCRYGLNKPPGPNVWSFLVQKLCSMLENKTKESLVLKLSVFTKLSRDMEENFFYPRSIYPTVDELKTEPKFSFPESLRNGRYEDDKEFLLFQFSRMKYYILSHIYIGLKNFKAELRTLRRDSKFQDKMLFEDKACLIFYKVRLYKSYREFMNFRDKYFLLDIAPHKRVDHKLPENVKKLMKDYSERLSSGIMFYLSTSSSFEDLIIANPIVIPNELLVEGFVIVDIVSMENVKQSIFERNLFLLTPKLALNSTYHTLNHLKKVSTVTLPMKEYFVNFETAAIVPDYENVKEYAFSLENINVRAGNVRETQLSPLGMNTSQFEAFQLALTRRLSLIQGPPGTGKSSVAFKIIQRLLKTTPHSFRIIIVSYRNYVLDRLLLRCAQFTDKIVRLGHFCALPEAKKYLLTSQKPPHKFSKINHDSSVEYSEAMTTFVDEMKRDSPSTQESFEKLQRANEKLNYMKYLKMYYTCRDARIIGMTTTGAAKYHDLLQLLRAPIVIMEEAAEVPEPHILNCLTDRTQQLILIGDHKQLQYLFELNVSKNDPKTSLFERLIENGVNNVCLNVQYRMHPDIADLVRRTIYKVLMDGENVKNYPPIRGVGRNLYCVNHENFETVAKDRHDRLRLEYAAHYVTSTSKENFYETLFTVGLATYLRQQGYQSQDIIILSAYSSQIEGIRMVLDKCPLVKDIETHTVDTYQGQESKIVILSLVRSNKEQHIGFLVNPQRLCVLLTRAQQGLFIVGNMDILAKKSKQWNEIKVKLEDKNVIGPGLPVQCEKHKCEMIMTGMEDFLKFTRDGCPVGETQPKGQGHPCLSINL